MPSFWKILGFGSPESSRIFIDAIRKVTSRWANWNPSVLIKVGDFGIIDRETGELEVKGNIYDEETQKRIFDAKTTELVGMYSPKMGTREGVYTAVSSNGRQIGFEVDPTVSFPGLAEASVKGRWSFDSRRGALLMMDRHQTSHIPSGVLLGDLAEVEALKGMYLVTEVFFCSAYSLFLSNKKNDDVSIALVGSAPIAAAAGATVGGQVKLGWWSSNVTGLFRHSLEPEGKDHYAPLYRLQKLRPKPRPKRGVVVPEYTGDDLWVDAEPPWDPLDQNGNEDGDLDDWDDDNDD